MLKDGSQGFIYVLFEHKSYYDRFVHLQLLEYMVKIWRLYIKQQEEEAGLPAHCDIAAAQTHQRSGFTAEAAGYFGTAQDPDGKRNRAAMAGSGDPLPGIGPG
ncbi:MAG: Rpn family recombination-promoting nuclease/putative transposase [Desulfotignum sp.]|nr:Rpn family recombination-promoting nuclease/putative transposase [Desulfotignum sp.]